MRFLVSFLLVFLLLLFIVLVGNECYFTLCKEPKCFQGKWCLRDQIEEGWAFILGGSVAYCVCVCSVGVKRENDLH